MRIRLGGCGSGVRAILTRGGVGVRGSRFFGVLNDTLGVGWGEGISKLTLIYVKIHKWGFLGTPS